MASSEISGIKKIVRRPVGVVPELSTTLDPLLQRIYAARGIHSSHELARGLEFLPSYKLLQGIDAATTLVHHALLHNEPILIVADFDADGATSCATLLRGLKLCGAQHVNYVVPNRFDFGYGLTPEIVQVAQQFSPALLITVDNGISSIEGVAAAKALGMKVLVTDHHLPGAQLPAADAIVNPNQPGDLFPSKALAGVGVVFFLIMALRVKLRDTGYFEQRSLTPPNIAQLLDLVALGTVADVVPLDHCNRILVAQGLARIRAGRACAGINALLQIGGREAARIAATDLGFVVGPRLNAAGRLDDMSLGIECLLSDDAATALNIATALDQLNRERRTIEAQMKAQALTHLEEAAATAVAAAPLGLCLYHAAWHQGVIGIVAARIKERYHRPVIAFALAKPGELKGSARSIPGLHIRDILDAVAARHPGLLSKFGGHAMAAGLTLALEDLEPFRHAFDAEVRAQATAELLDEVVYSDGELAAPQICLTLAETLKQGGPWGQGFPEPTFDGHFDLLDRRTVGGKHLKMVLGRNDSTASFDAIAFNTDDHHWPHHVAQVHVAYKLDINEYRGVRSAQLLVEYVAPVG